MITLELEVLGGWRGLFDIFPSYRWLIKYRSSWLPCWGWYSP